MEGKNLKLALREVGKLIRKKLKSGAKKDGFKATGDLDKSFRYRVIKNELHLFGEEYANALSKGVKKDSNYNKSSDKFREDIIKWARAKGIRPKRDKKGRFTSFMSMANAIAISVRRRGISKRFGYKGSGFVQMVKEQTQKEIVEILSAGYKKDILAELDKIKKIK